MFGAAVVYLRIKHPFYEETPAPESNYDHNGSPGQIRIRIRP